MAKNDTDSVKRYAVVETGGKQYMVRPGDRVHVERLDCEVGGKTEIGSVLAVSDGKELKVGTPLNLLLWVWIDANRSG